MRAAVTGAVACVLLWPAIYNRYPIVFPDTTAYLQVALGHSWTVDRSGFYGLLLKPFFLLDVIWGAWLAVAGQAAIVAAIVVAVTLRLVTKLDWPAILLLIIVAATSSLPWHASQLMPDAYAGALVLLSWLVASRRLDQPGTALMWLATTGLMLLHYTYLVIVPATVLACLGASYACDISSSRTRETLVALSISLAAAIGIQISANGLMFDRWAVSPMGSYFLFARLQEDGLVPDWMKRHCGRDASPELCAIEHRVPRDSQKVLWGGSASPLDSRINAHLNSRESWLWIDRLQQAATGAIEEEPSRFVSNTFRAGVAQFFHFQALDDECPKNCGFPGLTRSVPKLGARIRQTRQAEGAIPRSEIRDMTFALSIAGLLALFPTVFVAWRKRDPESFSLLISVAAALLVNAWLTGGLSDVHDRYQSRIVWLAPFAVAFVMLRWFQRESGRSEREVRKASPVNI
jgi:hypothetical protein